MKNDAIHERAVNKAFAKIAMLLIEKNHLQQDIETNNTGAITIDELKLMYEGTKIELKVWNYIAEAIEKLNKL